MKRPKTLFIGLRFRPIVNDGFLGVMMLAIANPNFFIIIFSYLIKMCTFASDYED